MVRIVSVLALFVMLGNPFQAIAQTPFDRTVSTADDLKVAAKSATTGGIIRLAPGDYESVELVRLRPSAQLRIVAADPARPPRVGRVVINNSGNLSLEGLLLSPWRFTPQRFGFIASVTRSSDIDLKRLRFEGGLEAQTARARALGITLSRNVNLNDSILMELDRGAVVSKSQNISLEHNRVTGMIVDGFNFAEVENVRIVGNHLASFRTGKAHPDFIQFWTNKTEKPSRDILIAENLLARDEGNVVQGIFMGNEFKLRYENVVIRDNIIIQEAPHGIAVYLGDNVIIENNVVLSVPSAKHQVTLRAIDSNGTVRNNTATVFDLKSFTGTMATNTIVPFQDKARLAKAERDVGEALKDKKGGSFVVAGQTVSAALRQVGPR